MEGHVWFHARSIVICVMQLSTMGHSNSPTNIEGKTRLVVWSIVIGRYASWTDVRVHIRNKSFSNTEMVRSCQCWDVCLIIILNLIPAIRLAADVVEMSFSFFPTRVRQMKSYQFLRSSLIYTTFEVFFFHSFSSKTFQCSHPATIESISWMEAASNSSLPRRRSPVPECCPPIL